jgi:hypothetical protein
MTDELLNQIDTLTTRLAELEAKLEAKLPCDVHLPPATIIRAGCSVETLLSDIETRRPAAEKATLTARVAELEEGLKPFAKPAETWPKRWSDDVGIYIESEGDPHSERTLAFVLGDLRRATALLENKR